MEPTEEHLEVRVGKIWHDNNLIWDHNFIVNGEYDLSDKIWSVF
jgi:hypothetical protein